MRAVSSISPFPVRRPVVQWVDYARRSWQRLGHLQVLCALAHPASGTNLEGLTERFKNVITNLQDIPPDLHEQVVEYLRAHRTNRYPRRRGHVSKVELQDLYLSCPCLQSQSGAITGDMDAAGYRHAVYVEMPAWAVRLRLLRRDNYTLTDRGKVLLQLSGHFEGNGRTFNRDVNPYLLTPGQRFFFCYCLLDLDGDLIQGIFSSISGTQRSFTRSEVGDIAADVLKSLSVHRLARAMSGQERRIKDRIAATVKSISNQRGAGMGPRESVATPRTEPLVDCGILERTHPSTYSYRLTEKGQPFLEALAQARSLGIFVETALAKWFVQPSIDQSPCGCSSMTVRNYVARSYILLRSGLGYCSIREVSLFAVAMAIDESSCIFEIADAEREIYEAARENGKDVRLTKSRQGDIAQVRIAPRILAECWQPAKVGHFETREIRDLFWERAW